MKKLIRLILFCLIISQANAQQKDFNLIILVDGKLEAGSLWSLNIIAVNNDGEEEKIEVSYYPGNLSLNEANYRKLMDSSVQKIYLSFYYTDFIKKKRNDYNYKVELKKGWFEDYFFILRVYNTDKKKYKYRGMPGKKYVVDYDYPGGGVIEVGPQKE